eukprot:403354908
MNSQDCGKIEVDEFFKKRETKDSRKTSSKDQKTGKTFREVKTLILDGQDQSICKDSHFYGLDDVVSSPKATTRNSQEQDTPQKMSNFLKQLESLDSQGSQKDLGLNAKDRNSQSNYSQQEYSQEIRESASEEQIMYYQNDQHRQSSSWSQAIRNCSRQNLKLSCLQSCSNWTLNMFCKSQKQSYCQKLMKIPACGCPQDLYNWKRISSPQEYETIDLIEEMVLNENIERLFKIEAKDILESYNKPGIKIDELSQSRDFSFNSAAKDDFSHRDLNLKEGYLPIKPNYPQVNSDVNAQFPHLISHVTNSLPNSADILVCLEFRIIKDSNDFMSPLRQVNNSFPNNEFIFEVGGFIHGRKLFRENMICSFSGKKVIQSIESRIKEYQNLQSQVGWTQENKRNSYLSYIVPLIDDGQRIAFEFHSPQLNKLQDFDPKFKKLVNCGGQIKKVFIQLAFNFLDNEFSFSQDMAIGLSYIFKDLLKHRKEEKDRLKRKRQVFLRDIEPKDVKNTLEPVTKIFTKEILNPENTVAPSYRDYPYHVLQKFIEKSSHCIALTHQSTIDDLLAQINHLTVFGCRFSEDEVIQPDSDVFVFLPFMSVLSLEIKNKKSRIRIESPQNSIYTQTLEYENMLEQIDEDDLQIALSELDSNVSYIGINWIFLMNVKSKIQVVKLPNIIVYYKFSQLRFSENVSTNSDAPLKLYAIGLQTNSLKYTQEWIRTVHDQAKNRLVTMEQCLSVSKNIKPHSPSSNTSKQSEIERLQTIEEMEYYFRMNQRLKDFIDIDKEIQTNRNIKRSDCSRYTHSSNTGKQLTENSNIHDKEKSQRQQIHHLDFHEYFCTFFDD